MRFVERLSRGLREVTPERAKPVLRRVRKEAKDLGSEARSLARAGTRGRAAEDRLPPAELVAEDELRHQLQKDPNDQQAFDKLVALIRRRAAEDQNRTEAAQYSEDEPGLVAAVELDQRQIGRDAVWAVAEELAGNQKAWYPLIELARLSVHEDREAAMRRLGTAADRDESGRALAEGMTMLRQEGMSAEALSLGTGHWRPREHDLRVGREMVESALEAGRFSEAKRHLEALQAHPHEEGRTRLTDEMGKRIARTRRPSADNAS
jgi:hypothetical protein